MHSEHFEKLLRLIDLEREAEKEENKRELERYPLQVRESLGKTVTRLLIREEDVGVGGIPLLVLGKTVAEGALSPFHGMNQGDNVLLTYPPQSPWGSVDGTLYDVGDSQVTVAISKDIPDPLPSGPCQLDLLGSDATYRRMKEALLTVKKTKHADLLRLKKIFMGEERPSREKMKPLVYVNTRLNDFQKEAVQKSMESENTAVVHGPPGTGKTTVLIEIILQTLKQGGRVLASAPSNIAVDNMVEKLLPHHVRLVRLGHPARILDPLRHATLSAQVEEHPAMEHVHNKDDDRHRLLKQLKRKENRGGGIKGDVRWELRREIQGLWREARDLEFGIKREIINNAQVVLATHGGITKMVGRKKFDLVIMDEASQATEPLSWVPILFGNKVVFAGDHCQLPPTIYSQEAVDQGLGVTLFEKLQKTLPADFKSMLKIQYRMHKIIMGFSSQQFYEDALEADTSVADHMVTDDGRISQTDLTQSPLHFIDTAGTGYEETWNELLESRENEGEAGLVVEIWNRLKESGVSARQMAILSPYVAQVKKIKLLIQEKPVEIGSVDSFQGREKEVVIVSLVRSNPKGEVGFLSDTRRMNVALTRAKKLLIVIGDSSTISQHPFYNDFLEYVEKHKAHRSAWEWIS